MDIQFEHLRIWPISEWSLSFNLVPCIVFKDEILLRYEYLENRIMSWIFYVFVLSCVCYFFVRVCLYVLCGHLLGKGWPLGTRLWCLLWVCRFPIGILGQVWYLIVSIPDLCTLTYFAMVTMHFHKAQTGLSFIATFSLILHAWQNNRRVQARSNY